MSETILDVLSSDHRSALALLDQLDRDVIVGLVNLGEVGDEGSREQLVIQLVRHFVAEEQYLYPLVRERLADGDRLADAGFAANRECEHALKALENPQADADYLAVSLATIRRLLTLHIDEQQDQLFPQLQAEVPSEVLAALADDALGAEQLAPTRPRTVAASNPALNKVSSLVEGFIDHVRDTYSRRGTEPE